MRRRGAARRRRKTRAALDPTWARASSAEAPNARDSAHEDHASLPADGPGGELREVDSGARGTACVIAAVPCALVRPRGLELVVHEAAHHASRGIGEREPDAR